MGSHVVLVTGATGAVGRPLVEALLRRADVDRVVALQHVEAIAAGDRLEVVTGDVTASDLGMPPDIARRVRAAVTTVLHAAADTRFTRGQTGVKPRFDPPSTGVRPGSDGGQTEIAPGSDQAHARARQGSDTPRGQGNMAEPAYDAAPNSDEASSESGRSGRRPRLEPRRSGVGARSDPGLTPNVRGVRSVIEFARGCGKVERIIALSTTHVAGRRRGCILEDELEHDAGFVNDYEASKHDAEIALRAAMPTLPISVCRLSTVVGDSTTGAIARPGAIHHAVRLMYAGLAPMIPGREDSPVDILAADYVARAVATLTTAAFEPGRTWHVCAGGDTIPAGELLDLTLATFARVRPAWRTRTIERPAIVPLETFELFCRSAERAGNTTLAAAASMMRAFAPQLAFPKRFDTRQSGAALAPHGLDAPPARHTWTRMIEHVAGLAS